MQHTDWAVAYGSALSRLRRRQEITQEEMAEALEMSRSHLLRIEKGRVSPQFDTTVTLAEFLGLMPDEFVREVRKEYDRLKRRARGG